MVVQVLINARLQHIVPLRSELLWFIELARKVGHDGVTLAKSQSILSVPDGWHSLHGV